MSKSFHNSIKESELVWIGLKEERSRRKIFRCVSEARVGANKTVAGIAIFEPGERCALHHHPDS